MLSLGVADVFLDTTDDGEGVMLFQGIKTIVGSVFFNDGMEVSQALFLVDDLLMLDAFEFLVLGLVADFLEDLKVFFELLDIEMKIVDEVTDLLLDLLLLALLGLGLSFDLLSAGCSLLGFGSGAFGYRVIGHRGLFNDGSLFDDGLFDVRLFND